MSDPQLIAIDKFIRNAVKAGDDFHKIREEFSAIWPQEMVDKALARAKTKLDKTYHLVDPQVIARQIDQTYQWYGGPHELSEYWKFAENQLKAEGRSDEEIADVVHSSAQVLGLLSSPAADKFASRGLVLGYVQSGKTTNFIATIAQAADEGYRLIIVLSGVTNNLRRQTQERLERSLTGENANNWNWLTSADEDFNASMNGNALLGDPSKRLIAVVKKNNSRLKKLKSWIEQAPLAVRQGLPVLIIDDEADQATVNSHKLLRRQTAINKTLTSMLKNEFLPKNAYLGYTATPFANILSDAKDETQLFPRDFIYPLKRADKYFGAEQLFGREPIDEEDQEVITERNIIVPIDSAERAAMGNLIDPNSNIIRTEIPDSLKDAINWFVVATAARRVRSGKNKFSTMLIHTSGRIPSHNDMKKLVVDYLTFLRDLPHEQATQLLKSAWESRSSDGWIQETDAPVLAWQNISTEVSNVLGTCKAIVDNSKSDDRLFYDFQNESAAEPYLVIGGNTLARGLTLEGLICSYFMRTSSAYDSLLQMGRWFGYRVGYEDLQRIWMQDDLISNFRDMALVEEEIRQQIEQLAAEGLDPSQVPIRIRDHKLLTITAVNKMNYARRLQIGYSETRVETIALDSTKEILLSNQAATRDFIKAIDAENIDVKTKNADGWPIFKDVPWHLVKSYFENYKWADSATRADGKMINSYIDAHQGTGSLEKWNVFVFKTDKANVPTLNLGTGITATAVTRSALEIHDEKSTVNIHHLVSSSDGSADVGLSRKVVKQQLALNGLKVTDGNLRIMRESNEDSKGRGLLGIYVIDADSKADPKSKLRKDLELPEHAIGLGIFFGTSKIAGGNVDYFGPDLVDQHEENDDDYLDDADESDVLAVN